MADGGTTQIADDIAKFLYGLFACPKQRRHIVVQVKETTGSEVLTNDVGVNRDVVEALEHIIVKRRGNSSSLISPFVGNAFINQPQRIILGPQRTTHFVESPPVDKRLVRKYDRCYEPDDAYEA